MISDKLYELAYRYKKTKLWKNLWETELFAVKLSGGRIGYISIMGSAGEHIALSLHIGENAFLSFRRLTKIDAFALSPLKIHELSIQQNCMQCSLENKDLLEQQEYEEAKSYFHRAGIRPSGKNSYPMFRKYTPNHLPWPLQAQEDQEDLCEALAAAIELSRILKEKGKTALGLEPLEDDTKEIPLLKYQDGKYQLGKTHLPAERPAELPEPIFNNDIALATFKKIKQAGVWECEIIRFPQPIQNKPEEIPVFPTLLLAVKFPDGYVLNVHPVEHYEEAPKELLNQFVDAMIQEKIYPAKIKVRDECTYAFAASLCEKLKIKLEIHEDLSALDEAEYSLLQHFNMTPEDAMDELGNLLYDMLDAAGEDWTDGLPDELLRSFDELKELGILSENIFDFGNTGNSLPPQKWTGPEQSFVISISLGTGCYRHIQVDGNYTLFSLHRIILEAFDFDDDHAHAFFMDNVFWSGWDCYYADGMNGKRSTDDYTLNQAGLHKGKQFKYIFDFGDEWRFQCKVLKVLEGNTPKPTILRSKGDAPEQYPSWDEDSWEDE